MLRLWISNMRWSLSQMRPSPGEKNRHSLRSARVGWASTLQRSVPAELSWVSGAPWLRAISAREIRGDGGMGGLLAADWGFIK